MAFWKDLNYLKLEKGVGILEDIPCVYQAIYSLFRTKKGQRVFRPEFGADLSRYLFEPCDEITASSMMYDITVSLREEPRVSLNRGKSAVLPDPENKRFLIRLALDIPGYRETQILDFTFNQKG